MLLHVGNGARRTGCRGARGLARGCRPRARAAAAERSFALLQIGRERARRALFRAIKRASCLVLARRSSMSESRGPTDSRSLSHLARCCCATLAAAQPCLLPPAPHQAHSASASRSSRGNRPPPPRWMTEPSSGRAQPLVRRSAGPSLEDPPRTTTAPTRARKRATATTTRPLHLRPTRPLAAALSSAGSSSGPSSPPSPPSSSFRRFGEAAASSTGRARLRRLAEECVPSLSP